MHQYSLRIRIDDYDPLMQLRDRYNLQVYISPSYRPIILSS